MTKTRSTLVAAAVAMAAAAPAGAAEVAGVFSRGHTHLSAFGGSGSAFGDNYVVLGLGASYYLTDGLSVGIHAESWTGGDPTVTKLTPSVQYVFYQVPRVSPYVGAFYRRTYIEDRPDLDSAGGRAGVYISAGRSVYIGVGGVYETYMDCDKAVYQDCTDSYPEISFTVAF